MSEFRGVRGFNGTTTITNNNSIDVPLTVQSIDATQTSNLIEVKKADGTMVLAVANSTTDPIQIAGVKVPLNEPVIFYPTAASTTQAIFIADAAYQVTAVRESHGVASTSGTLNVEKLTGTTAPGAGTAMLTGTMSLAGTANTVISGTLSGTVGNLQLAVGDRLGLIFAGTMTNLAGCNVVVSLKRI